MESSSFLSLAVAVVLGWLGWRRRSDISTIVKTAIAKLTASTARGSLKNTSGSHAARPPGSRSQSDVNETGATVVMHRGSFGSITCISGALLGRRWDIPGQGLSIGRDPASDVVIDDSRVSARHALIRPKQGEVVVVDDGSTNGVFLNDVRHRVTGEAILAPGDIVMLSSTDAAHFIYRK
jgi:hypothetical protein